MLKINSLNYNINERPLLENISMHLKKGENLIILGENGTGKSTLAKLICGLIKSKKKILLEHTYIENIPAKKRASIINYIPAKFSMYDAYITLKEYLLLSLDKAENHKNKLNQILTLLHLHKYQNSYPNTLSSGEQQLLLIASALMQNATVTIFDEPTSNLDPYKTKLVFDILQEHTLLKQKIIITHDLQLAYKLNMPILYLHDKQARYFERDFFQAQNLKHYFQNTISLEGDNIVQQYT